jgi:hypothetical protein
VIVRYLRACGRSSVGVLWGVPPPSKCRTGLLCVKSRSRPGPGVGPGRLTAFWLLVVGESQSLCVCDDMLARVLRGAPVYVCVRTSATLGGRSLLHSGAWARGAVTELDRLVGVQLASVISGCVRGNLAEVGGSVCVCVCVCVSDRRRASYARAASTGVLGVGAWCGRSLGGSSVRGSYSC